MDERIIDLVGNLYPDYIVRDGDFGESCIIKHKGSGNERMIGSFLDLEGAYPFNIFDYETIRLNLEVYMFKSDERDEEFESKESFLSRHKEDIENFEAFIINSDLILDDDTLSKMKQDNYKYIILSLDDLYFLDKTNN